MNEDCVLPRNAPFVAVEAQDPRLERCLTDWQKSASYRHTGAVLSIVVFTLRQLPTFRVWMKLTGLCT